MKYQTGEILFCKAGKYDGRKVEILETHALHNPTLYTCEVLYNRKKIALYETELETAFQHDLRTGLLD